MLIEAVHVQPAHGRINDSIYLKNKIFTFRVAKKLEKKIQKGMLVYSKDGQLVYIKNIISGRSKEEENEYTAVISKIFNETPSVLPARKGEETPKIRFINQNTIFEGLLLELKDKTLHKTKRKVYFKVPPTVHKKIGIGDIVIFSVKSKKYHVLIIQVYKPTQFDKEVSIFEPKFKPFFLKKAAKGFKKTDYITIPEEKNIVTSEKNQQINRKRPFTMRKTSK
ncbi:hypothetical protein IL314_13885 [Enterococcus faecium]|uniref:hypothetical protein n=1 Tax=Enterococcus faecium TaxID=1352 RepID=UPI00191460DD|nr:hypothetical protein [Enterococcus faecium]MBK5028760.1 hypothetical protein [Enterococcus faecium]MBK5039459.1 hypothetical protein [Enterococcus faecium]MBK5044262.1 hypothetical protein [Enterococcus faecium]MBK5069220.1 hypothetical protein [Enterococcus faecium]MBK5132702.1 hypothetical protein [Enterococcus faecium]